MAPVSPYKPYRPHTCSGRTATPEWIVPHRATQRRVTLRRLKLAARDLATKAQERAANPLLRTMDRLAPKVRSVFQRIFQRKV